MKRLLSALLALTLILTFAPVALAVEEAYPVEGGNIYIDWSTGTVTDADDTITSAVIPEGITSIGYRAFDECYNLKSVVITEGVRSIEDSAFGLCKNLTNIIIPDSVTSIGAMAFFGCDCLTSVTIPDGVTIINDETFKCSGLTSAFIPYGVTSIGDSAFDLCTNLTSVVIPDSVISVGNSAFSSAFEYSGVLSDIYFGGTEDQWYANGGINSGYNKSRVTVHFNSTGPGNAALESALTGDWEIDGAQTMSANGVSMKSIFGTFYQYGNSMEINADHTFAYYIAAGIGGDGEWCLEGDELYYEITQYEDASTESGTITINKRSEGDYYLIMQYLIYKIYWQKENTAKPAAENIYDTPDPGEGVADLVEGATDKVNSEASAVEAVNTLTRKMTTEQKQSATGADLATLLAETAAAKAASQPVEGKEIVINKANVQPLAEKAGSAVDAVDAALVSGGITTARYLANTVILTSKETGEISIKIDPDILETEVDKVRVETPNYALTLKISDLEEDLTGVITIKSSTVTASANGGGGAAMAPMFMKASAPRTASGKATAVKLEVPNGKLNGPVTISFPDNDGDDDGNETVVDADNNAKSSKYNPATSTMDGKVTESGTYTTTTNTRDFTDISSKSKEMQDAIKYLASKGIINGTTPTTFSPDGAIKRFEIAALLVRSLGKLDSAAKSTFADVKTSDWFYATAASSAKCGLIKGYEDNTFRGENNILKQETVTVVSRVLQTEMNYKVPTSTATYLTRYTDTIPDWVKQDLALATRENLIVYRVDGTFSGSKTITRGDAAIILYRMFQKIW